MTDTPTPAVDHDWLREQLRDWPRRVDLERTTNIEFLMKAGHARIVELEQQVADLRAENEAEQRNTSSFGSDQ